MALINDRLSFRKKQCSIFSNLKEVRGKVAMARSRIKVKKNLILNPIGEEQHNRQTHAQANSSIFSRNFQADELL